MFQERTTSSCTGCVTLCEEPGWAVGLVELERHVDHFLTPLGVVLSVYQWWVTWYLLLQLSCNYAPWLLSSHFVTSCGSEQNRNPYSGDGKLSRLDMGPAGWVLPFMLCGFLSRRTGNVSWVLVFRAIVRTDFMGEAAKSQGKHDLESRVRLLGFSPIWILTLEQVS